ncbi:MAG TPA: hypothetical protein VHE35_21675 [Kofleriaceae bacterium]|nr:hypothetical protein [Kofleriaceae bacterium]
MKRSLTIMLSLSLSLAACGKGGDKAADKGGKAAGKAPAAPAWIKLDPLPLQAQAPADAKVMDSSADAPAVMVSAEGCTFDVSTVTEAYPSTFDADKAETQKLTDGFKSFTKAEQSEGGWHLEFEGVSAIDNAPLYGVEVRTTINGKQYSCSRNDSNKAAIDCAAKACGTLKAI